MGLSHKEAALFLYQEAYSGNGRIGYSLHTVYEELRVEMETVCDGAQGTSLWVDYSRPQLSAQTARGTP